ncbi:MAG: ABC transporter permease, partial [Gammaproteobacteria bacterium]
MSSWRNIASLAYRDYSHEWHMSACFILGLAAVLAPLMVLFGVKFGIITNMMTSLSEDPGKREIRPLGSSRYTPEWFASVRARPEVAFVVPRTRTLAATVELRSRSAPFIVPAELI